MKVTYRSKAKTQRTLQKPIHVKPGKTLPPAQMCLICILI